MQVQLALLTATVKLFIKRPTAGQLLVPKVLKWATEEVDNPDLRDRGYIYWRLLSIDPAAATAIVLSEKPTISTESEALDRGLLDRLLLHTGTLSSIYGKEAHTFVRGARAKYLRDSPALNAEAKASYHEALRLPQMPPPPPTTSSSSTPISPTSAAATAPLVPPRPTRQDSGEAMIGGAGGAGAGAGLLAEELQEEDEEEEGAALNPTSGARDDDSSSSDEDERGDAVTPLGGGSPALSRQVEAGGGAGGDGEALDPYASLARMSMDGWGGGRGAAGGGEYGYEGPAPVRTGGGDEDLLL